MKFLFFILLLASSHAEAGDLGNCPKQRPDGCGGSPDAPITSLAPSMLAASPLQTINQCQIQKVGADGQVQTIGKIRLVPANPAGNYGILMKGSGYQFAIRVTTNICSDDKGCNMTLSGTSAEQITLGISFFGAQGASTEETISGRVFALGDPVTVSLDTNGLSIACTIQDGAQPVSASQLL
jgi:hypothetical protein